MPIEILVVPSLEYARCTVLPATFRAAVLVMLLERDICSVRSRSVAHCLVVTK